VTFSIYLGTTERCPARAGARTRRTGRRPDTHATGPVVRSGEQV